MKKIAKKIALTTSLITFLKVKEINIFNTPDI